MATLLPTISRGTPIETPKQSTTRILEAGFGDGYTQRAADGLNGVIDSWVLAYKFILIADATTLETFMRARGGWQAIEWTPPGESTALKWTCKTWSREKATPELDHFTFELKQVFDL